VVVPQEAQRVGARGTNEKDGRVSTCRKVSGPFQIGGGKPPRPIFEVARLGQKERKKRRVGGEKKGPGEFKFRLFGDRLQKKVVIGQEGWLKT